ncbi:MAG: C40 family peptidase [Desulfofustis sp.]|nr:C40 family peptidase [Desulfofustis sp.]
MMVDPKRAACRVLVIGVMLVAVSSCAPKTRIDYSEPADRLHSQEIVHKLLSHYRQWRSVPYRSGGAGKSGIDCSAFVAVTYQEQFGIDLPRTTDHLAGAGNKVAASVIQPGDLLLFKTGFFTRHIGISLDRGRFIHASTSRGVVLSSLAEPYWRERLWQVRRVMN